MERKGRGASFGAVFAAAWRRGQWSCVFAGATLTLIALAAWMIALGGEGLPGLRREDIGVLMRLEGYAFATGFLFAMILPWCMSAGRIPPGATWVAFLLSVGLVGSVFGSTRPGWPLMAAYAAMVGATYLGALLDPRGAFSSSAWWQRVLTVVALFISGTTIFGTPIMVDSWSQQASVMRLAAYYFSLFALAEWSGVYHLRRADWRALRAAFRPVSIPD